MGTYPHKHLRILEAELSTKTARAMRAEMLNAAVVEKIKQGADRLELLVFIAERMTENQRHMDEDRCFIEKLAQDLDI